MKRIWLLLILTSCTPAPSPAVNKTDARCLADESIQTKAAHAAFFDSRYACLTMAKSRQESGCRATAESKFAIGNDQFTIPTAIDVSKTVCRGLGVIHTKAEARRKAKQKSWSIPCSAKYLAQLNRMCIKKGFQPGKESMGCAHAAYNAGAGWIFREQKVAKQKGLDYTKYFGVVDRICLRSDWACKENQGIPPKYRGYSKRIMGEHQVRFSKLGVPCVNYIP